MKARQLFGLGLMVITAGASVVLTGHASAGRAPASHGTPDRRAVPILMYHVIAESPASAPFPDLYVRGEELQAQVRLLAAAGYEAVTLGRVFDAWRGRATLPPRPIVLTFDDGYRSHVTAALPILAAQHWPGVLNLDLSNLEPSWGVGRRGVRKLIAAGWAIDAHSMTHADLALANGATLTREISGSRREILRLFGVLPRFFCYPAGRYDAAAVAAVKAAGYEGATTGLASPDEPFTLAGIGWIAAMEPPGLARKLVHAGLPVSPRSTPARRPWAGSPPRGAAIASRRRRAGRASSTPCDAAPRSRRTGDTRSA